MEALGSVALFGGLFTFLAVAAWAGNRTRERELYYRNELLKKAMDGSTEQTAAVLAHIREEELAAERKRARDKRVGMLTGGMTVTAVGLGLMVFMRMMPFENDARNYYLVGLIPLLVGVSLIAGSRLGRHE